MLIVHLKRFAGSAKISSPVEFPLEGLDLSEVVKSPQVRTRVCVCVYIGGVRVVCRCISYAFAWNAQSLTLSFAVPWLSKCAGEVIYLYAKGNGWDGLKSYLARELSRVRFSLAAFHFGDAS